MGALRGTLTYARFFVTGEVPADLAGATLKRIRAAASQPLVNAHLRDAEAALLERKGLERLGKKARADLKLFVTKKLRRQLLPVTKSIDFVWNVNTGVARYFSQSSKLHLLVQDLFERTFRLKLVPESPGTAAERSGLDPRTEKLWEALRPTSLGEAP